MEKIAVIVSSFEDSDRADKEFYLRLTPQERLAILFELNRRWPVKDDAATPHDLREFVELVTAPHA